MKFIKEMLTDGTGVSSKRTFGGIAFLAVTIRIVGWESQFLVELLGVSAMLLGLDSIGKMFNKNNYGNTGKKNSTKE